MCLSVPHHVPRCDTQHQDMQCILTTVVKWHKGTSLFYCVTPLTKAWHLAAGHENYWTYQLQTCIGTTCTSKDVRTYVSLCNITYHDVTLSTRTCSNIQKQKWNDTARAHVLYCVTPRDTTYQIECVTASTKTCTDVLTTNVKWH